MPDLLNADPSQIQPFPFGTGNDQCADSMAYFSSTLLGEVYEKGDHGGSRPDPPTSSFQRHQLEAVVSWQQPAAIFKG